MAMGPFSTLSVAFICLLDAVNVALGVDYALFQAYIHLEFFRNDSPNVPQEDQAIYYSRFYIDDAALRMYAAGEHIANSIINLVGISKKDIESKGKVSLAGAVGNFLLKKQPNLQVTQIVKNLAECQAWVDVINYRNEWVHNQPRLVEHPGPGVNYKRRSRWKEVWKDTYFIGIGGNTWDRAEVTIDNLLVTAKEAGFALEKAISELSDLLYKELEPKIIRNQETGELIPKDLF